MKFNGSRGQGLLGCKKGQKYNVLMLELVRERREIPSHAYKDPAGYGKLNFVMLETSCHTHKRKSIYGIGKYS